MRRGNYRKRPSAEYCVAFAITIRGNEIATQDDALSWKRVSAKKEKEHVWLPR